MKRRSALAIGTAAALGIGAGVATGWWRRPTPVEAAAAPPSGPGDLWSVRAVRPDGTPMDLAPFRGRPLLVNFWATWCVPCITELPLLASFHAAQSAAPNGWQVLGLALDTSANVKRFLERQPVALPLAVLGPDAYDLPRRLGNPSGGLPFSVVFDVQGRPATRHLGAVDQTVLNAWVTSLN